MDETKSNSNASDLSVKAETETHAQPDPEPAAPANNATAASAAVPPDGGFPAWSTVAGCFLAYFASFGFVIAFGVFQAFYEALLPRSSSSAISWIGSIQLWLITGMALPSVILNAHVGTHITLAIGTFFIVFGVMMASLATEYYQFLLSHGLCTGIGIGLIFLPIIGLPNQWFSKRRALALGLAMGGSSVGGVVWSIMINELLNYDNVSYHWVFRAVGFTQLGVMAAALALIHNNVPPNKSVKLRTFPFKMALSDWGVDFFGLALLLQFFGVYIPIIYAPLYAQAVGATAYTAFNVSAALNAATFFGRFIMGALGDVLGRSNTLSLCVLISAILAFAWVGATSIAGVFVWAVFYGWFSGASISLQSSAAINLVPEGKLQLIGPYIAILCQLSCWGALGGGPIAGALLGRSASLESEKTHVYRPHDFHTMMWFTGCMLLGSLVSFQVARYRHTPNFLAKA